MTNLSSFLETRIQQYIFDGDQLPSPSATTYVALHSSHPTNDGTENELDAPGYSRVGVGASDWTVTDTNPSIATNDETIQWEPAESDWGGITHITLWDGPETADNVLAWAPLDSSTSVAENERAEFEPDALTFELD